MQYTEKVMEHFHNPANVGQISDASGIGEIGSEQCGDLLRVYIKVVHDRLVNIKYKVYGCPAAIACCSMMSEMAIGSSVNDRLQLTDEMVANALGGLPAQKFHCSNLAASALHKAIINYQYRNFDENISVNVKTLMDNELTGNLQTEHGLSLWIEYGNKNILFDTGQSDLFIKNAEKLGVDLTKVDAVVISHGHYDHSGGFEQFYKLNKDFLLYIHPKALQPRFSLKNKTAKYIGVSDRFREIVNELDNKKRVIWTQEPTQIYAGIFVTGRIPRVNDIEDSGGQFFTDENCGRKDIIVDDQAIFYKSNDGLALLTGCAHSGIVNTLKYASQLSGEDNCSSVIGGLHLLKASEQRLEYTFKSLKEYNVKKIKPMHCTGGKAKTRLN